MTHEQVQNILLEIAELAVDGYKLRPEEKMRGLAALHAIRTGNYSNQERNNKVKDDASKGSSEI